MSALPPKADMCSATAKLTWGAIARRPSCHQMRNLVGPPEQVRLRPVHAQRQRKNRPVRSTDEARSQTHVRQERNGGKSINSTDHIEGALWQYDGARRKKTVREFIATIAGPKKKLREIASLSDLQLEKATNYFTVEKLGIILTSYRPATVPESYLYGAKTSFR